MDEHRQEGWSVIITRLSFKLLSEKQSRKSVLLNLLLVLVGYCKQMKNCWDTFQYVSYKNNYATGLEFQKHKFI